MSSWLTWAQISDHLKWHVLTLAAQRGLCGNSPSKAAAMGNCRFRQGTITGTEWHTWAGKISAVQLMLGGAERPNPPWVSYTHRGQLPSQRTDSTNRSRATTALRGHIWWIRTSCHHIKHVTCPRCCPRFRVYSFISLVFLVGINSSLSPNSPCKCYQPLWEDCSKRTHLNLSWEIVFNET